jgi:hypothetical protein
MDKVTLRIFVINCPAWLTPNERANIILLHTSSEKAKSFATQLLSDDHHHVFDFATNKWSIEHVPVPRP